MPDTDAARVFADPDQFAVCLLLVGLDRMAVPGRPAAESPINWAPRTWVDELTDLCGSPPHPRNVDRLMAACAIHVVPDEFYTTAAGFGDVAQALCGDWFDTAVWSPPSTGECLWAAAESFMIDPSPGGRVRFGPEVRAYADKIARHDGYAVLPEVFNAFGLPAPAGGAFDYSEEPDRPAAAAAGHADREGVLSRWLARRMTDLAGRLRALPLIHGDAAATAEEILKSVPASDQPAG